MYLLELKYAKIIQNMNVTAHKRKYSWKKYEVIALNPNYYQVK